MKVYNVGIWLIIIWVKRVLAKIQLGMSRIWIVKDLGSFEPTIITILRFLMNNRSLTAFRLKTIGSRATSYPLALSNTLLLSKALSYVSGVDNAGSSFG